MWEATVAPAVVRDSSMRGIPCTEEDERGISMHSSTHSEERRGLSHTHTHLTIHPTALTHFQRLALRRPSELILNLPLGP